MPVSYSACLRAVQDMHASNPIIPVHVELSQAACEGAQAETSSCFIGCALGNEIGIPALFTFQRPSVAAEFADYMSHRCADNSEHPFCLCAAPDPPSPPPERTAVSLLAQDYVYAGRPIAGSLDAHPSAYYKPAAIDRKLPSEFASGATEFQCFGSDSGAPTCARHCATELMGQLRAFHVTGKTAPPSPPPPSPPPAPPAPPPAPSPPLSEFRFNGATDGCVKNGIFTGDVCRDGGVGSVAPRAPHATQPLYARASASLCTECVLHALRRRDVRLWLAGKFTNTLGPTGHTYFPPCCRTLAFTTLRRCTSAATAPTLATALS